MTPTIADAALEMCMADLLAAEHHIESLRADIAVYRDIATTAIHHLHDDRRDLRRARERIRALVEDNRGLRTELDNLLRVRKAA